MCMREEKNLDAATMHQGYGARACVCLKNSLPLVSTLEYFVGFHHNERLKAYVAGVGVCQERAASGVRRNITRPHKRLMRVRYRHRVMRWLLVVESSTKVRPQPAALR